MLGDPLLQCRYRAPSRQAERAGRQGGARAPRTTPRSASWRACTATASSALPRRFVEHCGGNLLGAFRRAAGRGQARAHHLRRHARLPAADARSRARVRAQIEVGGEHYRRALRPPTRAGIWLAGVRLRAAASTRCWPRRASDYFFVDTHGILYAEPRPRYGVLRADAAPRRRGRLRRATPNRASRCGAPSEGYPGRPRLPRVLPRHRLRPRLRLHPAATCTRRRAPEHRASSTTGSPATDAATRSRTTRARRSSARRSTPATSCSTARSRSSGCARQMDAAAADRRALRRRALRPLVVRGAAVPRGFLRQAARQSTIEPVTPPTTWRAIRGCRCSEPCPRPGARRATARCG